MSGISAALFLPSDLDAVTIPESMARNIQGRVVSLDVGGLGTEANLLKLVERDGLEQVLKTLGSHTWMALDLFAPEGEEFVVAGYGPVNDGSRPYERFEGNLRRLLPLLHQAHEYVYVLEPTGIVTYQRGCSMRYRPWS